MLRYRTAPIRGDITPSVLPPAFFEFAAARRGEAYDRRASALLLLAELLAEEGIPPSPIDTLPGGKPYFPAGGVQFSMSHAGELCAVAIASAPVGIDLEPYDRPLPPARMERLLSYYSEEERRAVLAAPSPRREFIRLFTAKEAAVKRSGEGLAGLSAARVGAELIRESVWHGGREYCLSVLPSL